MNKPTPKATTDSDFYIRIGLVDWDYIDIDMTKVDLIKAAELIKLAVSSKVGVPVSIPVLIEYHPDTEYKHRWRVVDKHTYAYAAVKLAKLWGSKDSDIKWDSLAHPCESAGMVRCTVLNQCAKGTQMGLEQPSQQYIDTVLAML